MDDYRGEICLVSDKLVLRCLAQDFHTQRLYFALPKHLEHLDCEYCNVPSFEVKESDVRLLDKDEIFKYITSHHWVEDDSVNEFTDYFK